MIFHFVKIMDDLEFFHQKTPKNRLAIRFFSGNMLKYQDSTTFLVHTNHRWLFEKYVWFHWDLLMIFHFVKIMDDLEFFHQNTSKKRLIIRRFWGEFLKYYTKNMWGLRGPKNLEILEFQKVEISKIQIFQGCSLIFSCIFEVDSWEIRGSRVHYGSKKSKNLEVPKSIQKVLESIRNRYLAILE